MKENKFIGYLAFGCAIMVNCIQPHYYPSHVWLLGSLTVIMLIFGAWALSQEDLK